MSTDDTYRLTAFIAALIGFYLSAVAEARFTVYFASYAIIQLAIGLHVLMFDTLLVATFLIITHCLFLWVVNNYLRDRYRQNTSLSAADTLVVMYTVVLTVCMIVVALTPKPVASYL